MPSKTKISPELQTRVTPSKVAKAKLELAEKPKTRSKAWKGLEYAVAEVLVKAGFKKAKRYMKLDQMAAAVHSEELCDIRIPEVPHIKIDTKYSSQRDGKGWDKVEALYLKCKEKYAVKSQDRFIMVTQKSSSRYKLAHIEVEFFAELLALAYLGGKNSDSWSCPRCKQEALSTGPTGIGQELHSCGVCNLQFVTQAGTI